MNIKIALGLHAIGLAHHLYAAHFTHHLNFTGIKSDRILDIGRYNLRYFTSWNMIIQTMYLTLCIVNDLFLLYGTHFSPKLYRRFANVRGYLFTAFVFPCAMMVFSLFWMMFTINRDWVLPLEADRVLPGWLNHSIHTNILGLLLVELLLPYTTTPSTSKAMRGLMALSAAYFICYFGTYWETGRWLYGIYDVLSWPQRFVFVIFNLIFTAFLLRLGIFLQNLARNFVGFKDSKFYQKIIVTSAKKTL